MCSDGMVMACQVVVVAAERMSMGTAAGRAARTTAGGRAETMRMAADGMRMTCDGVVVGPRVIWFAVKVIVSKVRKSGDVLGGTHVIFSVHQIFTMGRRCQRTAAASCAAAGAAGS